MKVAFHFNALHSSLSSNYANKVEKLLFNILLSYRKLNLSSKIFTGDLPLLSLAYEVTKADDVTETREFKSDKYVQMIKLWLQPEKPVWSSLIKDRLEQALMGEIFIIGFETIEVHLAAYLNDQLRENSEAYIGLIEVDDAYHIHWLIYSDLIVPRYRINNKTASVFWDGISEESQDKLSIKRLTQLGFTEVSFESLNGKYTIFDEYHDFEQARRIAEWKKNCGNLLAFIADEIAHKLGDTAPDLGNKLWAALRTFNEAETNEEFSQVAVSCRRIIEYVSDELLPSLKEDSKAHKFEANPYRTRLLNFADEAKNNDININLIMVSRETLDEQIKKLLKLANEGIHKQIYRAETRRCLLRTIMLLDDIVSLKAGAFEIKPKLNVDDMLEDIFGL
ncbi:MAG: hypothetical protein RBJ76_08700 [Stenomitos frigidus ULC029]